MRSISKPKTRAAAILAAATLLLGSSVGAYDRDSDRYRREDDRYVFATTRGVNHMDAPTALKVPLLPVAVILDIVFLPFAALADMMTH